MKSGSGKFPGKGKGSDKRKMRKTMRTASKAKTGFSKRKNQNKGGKF